MQCDVRREKKQKLLHMKLRQVKARCLKKGYSETVGPVDRISPCLICNLEQEHKMSLGITHGKENKIFVKFEFSMQK